MPTDQPTLTLHMHPLASYCWKVLVALYEAVTAEKVQSLASRLLGQPLQMAVIGPFASDEPFRSAVGA